MWEILSTIMSNILPLLKYNIMSNIMTNVLHTFLVILEKCFVVKTPLSLFITWRKSLVLIDFAEMWSRTSAFHSLSTHSLCLCPAGDDVYLEWLHCDWEAQRLDRRNVEDAGRGSAETWTASKYWNTLANTRPLNKPLNTTDKAWILSSAVATSFNNVFSHIWSTTDSNICFQKRIHYWSLQARYLKPHKWLFKYYWGNWGP